MLTGTNLLAFAMVAVKADEGFNRRARQVPRSLHGLSSHPVLSLHGASLLTACPANAIAKCLEDGIVAVDREACLGQDACVLCLDACPYDAPQFGAEEKAKMQKCISELLAF
jgi:Fe-S-cluster-containing hydrogenase component 2